MKKINVLIIVIATHLLPKASFSQLTIPPPSPLQVETQQFATGKIEISYSRPAVKGRKIFGELVPYDKIWRTGANAATTIYFSDEVIINNIKITKGKYGLLTIPGKSFWEVIISKDTTVTNAADYKQENDVVRVKVKPKSLSQSVENFTINIDNIKPNSCYLQLIWDKTLVQITINADIDAKIMAQIDEAMKGEKKPYYQAANYYYENNKDMAKALEWVNEAVKANPNAYWILHLKAKIQLRSKDFDGAIATAKESHDKAEGAKNSDYMRLNDKLIAEANKLKKSNKK
jgi:tetratricopeptide (TPR) repeat protein